MSLTDKVKKTIFGNPKVVGILVGMTALVSQASAATINWTDISEILTGVGTDLFPAIVTMIIAAVPILIIIAIIGFVLGFLDKILEMLKLK
jgi:hypothetical protein